MEWVSSVTLLIAGAGFVSWYLKTRNGCPLSHLPLPPSPKGLPFIGNLTDMPTSLEWITYHKWSKELGTDIISLNVAGTSIMILDTVEAATELFEKRSSVYSGRPRSPMIHDLMGWDFVFGLMPYGERWRRHRRLIHQSFHPSAIRQFRPHLLKATHNLLNRFLDNPDDIIGNIRHMAGQTIMSIAYGIQVKAVDDPYIKLAEQAVHPLVSAAVPGAFLVDALPFLKYVPEWVPGAGFQKKAREWKRLARAMAEVPFAAAKENIARGASQPSLVSLALDKLDEGSTSDVYAEDIIRDAAAAMYTGGSDTTVAAIGTCILALLERPNVLKKAQQELDRVIQPGHLPDFDDKENLPYITAIAKETLRWRDVAPMGKSTLNSVPHCLDVDDHYKGYRLPAGSIVVANAWAMLHDEEVYCDPFTFEPDRFMKDGQLDKSVRDPSHACWGFGRRVCPGRYMAFSAVWIAIASLLTVFDIQKAVDEDGNIIEPSHEYLSGLIHFPKPFKGSIKPRSKEAEEVIRSSANLDTF